MSTFKPINIWSLITANPCPYLCAWLTDETVAFYLKAKTFEHEAH